MPNPSEIDSLNRISTNWSEMFAAHGDGPQAREAQCAVLRRYGRSIIRYLSAATGDPNVAEDLSQEFALRFLRGDFRRLHPARGRCRDFVKTVLVHLVADYYRDRKVAPKSLSSASDPATPTQLPAGPEAEFDKYWRGALLDRAWDELRGLQDRGNAPLYSALRIRAENPKLPSTEGAKLLSKVVGRQVSAAGFRQMVHRARGRFVELLRLEVAFSLGTNQKEVIDCELADLELLAYCRIRPQVD